MGRQKRTARPIARSLGAAEPEPRGFLIVGANTLARAIGESLMKNGYRVLLADTSRDRIAKARMMGLPVYLGNPISEHADRHMDLVGIGRLMALSHHESINAAAVMRYRMEFGRGNVFMIRSRIAEETPERLRLSAQAAGTLLFNTEQTYAELASLIELGNTIRTTLLTDQFSLEDLNAHHGPETILLYAIDPKGGIQLATEQNGFDPQTDWQVACIVPGDDAAGQS